MNDATLDLTAVSREEVLIRALLDGRAYPHPAQNIRLLDTHISWVILTGPYAYKIKKPLELEFLDYSTLERRKHFCEEEMRLNSRWAPELYVDVAAISGTYERPDVGGDGEAVEYAVRMHQFPQSAQLDVQLDNGLVEEEDMLALAETIADKHGAVDVCRDLGVEDARRLVRHPMLENVEHLKAHVPWQDLESLATWTSDSLETLWPILLQRQDDGFVRECHGDLKLSNLVRLESGIVAFDCVEFNADLRDIDTISDTSFLVMDLEAFERRDLAYVFLNRYLECTGDYAGMTIFALYYVYHALIRAKIAAIRSVERQHAIDVECDLEEMNFYCDVARRWIESDRPVLVLMHGFSGSGKTWLSQQLLSRLPAIRVRSDIERKRAFGLGEQDSSDSAVGAGIYSADSRRNVYAALGELAEALLGAGQNVIVDASFLGHEDRRRLHAVAERLGCGFAIVDLRADQGVLERRLRERGGAGGDASEADVHVLRYQFEHAEPLDDSEAAVAIAVDVNGTIDADSITRAILEAQR